ncbi:CAP domain-containing protein [Roseobacter ponti]|uniref:CAP domain-containing protein n=1 Tax=Roseobacter ponti TaxID=1891787 RepID=UPI001FEC42B8|nr:CAP domain-containing protein [Roseobacter ponti]
MKPVATLLILLLSAQSLWAGEEAVRVLNQFRADQGRAAVGWSERLEQAAAGHARDMLENGFFSHTGSDGSDIGQRVARTGYKWCYIAENIARGQRSLYEVMDRWAASSGHRRNMLLRDVREFALVEGPGRIWVMVLAQPC